MSALGTSKGGSGRKSVSTVGSWFVGLMGSFLLVVLVTFSQKVVRTAREALRKAQPLGASTMAS